MSMEETRTRGNPGLSGAASGDWRPPRARGAFATTWRNGGIEGVVSMVIIPNHAPAPLFISCGLFGQGRGRLTRLVHVDAALWAYALTPTVDRRRLKQKAGATTWANEAEGEYANDADEQKGEDGHPKRYRVGRRRRMRVQTGERCSESGNRALRQLRAAGFDERPY